MHFEFFVIQTYIGRHWRLVSSLKNLIASYMSKVSTTFCFKQQEKTSNALINIRTKSLLSDIVLKFLINDMQIFEQH